MAGADQLPTRANLGPQRKRTNALVNWTSRHARTRTLDIRSRASATAVESGDPRSGRDGESCIVRVDHEEVVAAAAVTLRRHAHVRFCGRRRSGGGGEEGSIERGEEFAACAANVQRRDGSAPPPMTSYPGSGEENTSEERSGGDRTHLNPSP